MKEKETGFTQARDREGEGDPRLKRTSLPCIHADRKSTKFRKREKRPSLSQADILLIQPHKGFSVPIVESLKYLV